MGFLGLFFTDIFLPMAFFTDLGVLLPCFVLATYLTSLTLVVDFLKGIFLIFPSFCTLGSTLFTIFDFGTFF